jgi:hypothetical protein
MRPKVDASISTAIMAPDSFRFQCPSCGQRIAAPYDSVGATESCPTCGTSIVVPHPVSPAAAAIHSLVVPKTNPLLLPLISVSIFLIAASVAFVFYISRTPNEPVSQADRPAANDKSPASPEPTPLPATSKPIPDSTQARILSLIEKGSKLRTMTDQGTSLTLFKDQLAEVKSGWETLTIAGWPLTLNHEEANFDSAIQAWSLAADIWDAKLRAERDSGDKFLFALDVYKIYGERLRSVADLVARRANDESVKAKLERITVKDDKHPEGATLPDWAIQWCFTAASASFDKAREGLRERLKK